MKIVVKINWMQVIGNVSMVFYILATVVGLLVPGLHESVIGGIVPMVVNVVLILPPTHQLQVVVV